MPELLLLATMAANPALIRIDLQDALRLPSGVETPPADPLVIWVRAPAAWVKAGGISEAGKTAVLARLYGGPAWMNGNSDGSTYVVKSFKSTVLPSGSKVPEEPHAYWYEVLADGSLDKRGPGFGPPAAPKQPQSLIGSAEKGSIFKQGPKLDAAFLAKHKGTVKLAVTLKRGQVGFDQRGAKAGPLEFRCNDTALGVSLDDRALQACGGAETCELWLVGTWKDGVLNVTKVMGTPSELERKEGLTAHIWLQEG